MVSTADGVLSHRCIYVHVHIGCPPERRATFAHYATCSISPAISGTYTQCCCDVSSSECDAWLYCDKNCQEKHGTHHAPASSVCALMKSYVEEADELATFPFSFAEGFTILLLPDTSVFF